MPVDAVHPLVPAALEDKDLSESLLDAAGLPAPLLSVAHGVEGQLEWRKHGDRPNSDPRAFPGGSASRLAYRAGWGCYPSGGLGLVLLIVLILLLMGRI